MREPSVKVYGLQRRGGMMGRIDWAVAIVGLLVLASEAQSVRGADDQKAALVQAVRRQETNVIQSLMQSEVDVNATTADGSTALHWAVFHQDDRLVAALLKRGAKPNVKNRFEVTPLEMAASHGGLKATDLLLDHGADANLARDNGESPLMFAARNGRAEVVERLIASEANVNNTAVHGQSALMWAAAGGHLEAVQSLVLAGADPNTTLRSGFTAFFFAVRNGSQPVVEYFIDQGVDVNQVMKREKGGRLAVRPGTSALTLAIENGHFELAARLLEAGADPNDQRTKFAPLHMLSWVRKPNRGDGEDGQPAPQGSGGITSLEFVEILIRNGAEVNLRLKEHGGGRLNTKGATPFFMAADTADLPLMKRLLSLGADPSITNTDGTTPLMVASGLGTFAPGEEAGTEAEALAAVELLLELGADINEVDKRGETAMHGAAYKNLPLMVHYLDEHGAKIEIWNRENRRGWTPIEIAEGYRPGNFKPAPDTLAALLEVISTD